MRPTTIVIAMRMQKLLQVLFDIILLRKGPEDLPHSWLVFYLCSALWLLALAATTLMIRSFETIDAWVALGSAGVGILCFGAVLVIAGYRARLLQTVSALIGCGALISLAMLAVLVLLTPFLGRNIANLTAFLLLAWSVPVKGHIIARATNRHWYVGIVVALSIFMLQLAFTQSMTPGP